MRWKALSGVLLAGILADALAKTDEDVDRGVELYEAGDFEGAVEAFEAAEDRRGERPEIFYDKGLALMELDRLEEAKTAFERGIESDDVQVRASSFYELGNLAFDAEDWAGAIAAYKDCLRTDSSHQNAKWNLEVAMERLRKEQEEQEKNQDEQNQDGEQGDEGEQQEGEDEQEQEQDGEQGEDEQDQQEGEDEQEGEDNQDGQGEQGEEEQDEQEQEGQGEQEQDGEQEEQEQPQPQNEPGEQEEQEQEQQPGEPQPGEAIDASDIDAQLEQLDEQDDFIFGVPQGKTRVDKDW